MEAVLWRGREGVEAQKNRGTIGVQETEREGQGKEALRELEVGKKCNMLSFFMYQCVRILSKQ